MQIKECSTMYDVVVVDYGAGGGMATKILADSDLKVAVVEAGPFFDPKDPERITQLRVALGISSEEQVLLRPFGDFDSAYGGWDIEGGFLPIRMAVILDGSVHACSAAEPITGAGFHYDLAPRILSIRTRTD